MKDLGKALLIVVAVVLAFTPMFMRVHAKATDLDTCVNEYRQSSLSKVELVDYCEKKLHGKVK